MGWDAYAYRSVQNHLISLDIHDPKPHLDAEMRRVFEQASAELKRQTGRGGLRLCYGELGGDWSQKCLSLATPISCYVEDDERGVLRWSPEIVQKANALADWTFGVEEIDEDYADWLDLYTDIKNGARFLLQTCAQNGYAILFTW